MAKELIWHEEMISVYGLARDFKDKEDFIKEVKNQYEDGECELSNIRIESCIYSETGVQADLLMPVSLTDIYIENYYYAQVEALEGSE